MVQIIQEKRKPSFREQLGSALGAGTQMLPDILGQIQHGREEEQASKQFKEQFGYDLGSEGRKEFMKAFGKSAGEQPFKAQEQAQKMQQQVAPFMAGIDTVNQMRELRKRGNLGKISGATSLFSEDTRRDRMEYSQLGKSLISLASNIPIRNQQEFNTLAENLYDPNLTDAGAEGILNAMEGILKRSMMQYGASFEQPEQQQQQTQEGGKAHQRRPMAHFFR